MMRKLICLLLVLILGLSGLSTVFGAESLEDVKGTEFEDAVNALIEKGVISGYPDGTFRPADSISRAEACVLVVKSMNPTEKELDEALYSGFPDLSGFDWAKKYIRYAVQKAVISGYPDGTFVPGNDVTYNEMAAMLVRALGYKVEELSGDWPENFISKAQELGMLDELTFEGDSPALRGHVALMTYSVVDDIVEANKPSDEEEEDEADDEKDMEGPLADFSGRAYGIILDTAEVLNSDGDHVQQVEFLFGKDILYINTNGKFDLPTADELEVNYRNGEFHGLQMTDGIIRKVDDSKTSFAAIRGDRNFDDLTADTWRQVKEYSNEVVKVDNGVEDKYISILEDASIYVAVLEDNEIVEYKAGSLRDIKKDRYIRLYNVTGNDPGVAEVVLVSEYISKK